MTRVYGDSGTGGKDAWRKAVQFDVEILTLNRSPLYRRRLSKNPGKPQTRKIAPSSPLPLGNHTLSR